MQQQRIPTFVCLHGLLRQNCSRCWSHRSYNDLLCALEKQVEAARPRLLRLTQILGIGPDEAEDVVQETYLEAWKHLEKLQPDRVLAWLDGICRNICKRYRQKNATAYHLKTFAEGLDEEPFSIVDPHTIDPVEELERQDRQILLDRAFSYLEESARELIELCYLEELPQREVAERLSLSLGALELKLHRTRHRLHQILHGQLREEALAFGLLREGEESMGWQETRLWCFLCGKRHLRGIVEQQSPGGAIMRLRCPVCSSHYNTDLTNTARFPGALGPIRSFRPAFKRVMQAGSIYYQTLLRERHCQACQSPVEIQLIDRSMSTYRSHPFDALPLGIYALIDCPCCGTDCCEIFYPTLCHSAIRDFLLRPRVLHEPTCFSTYEGSEAIRFRLLDLPRGDTLTVMVHPQTLHVLAAIER